MTIPAPRTDLPEADYAAVADLLERAGLRHPGLFQVLGIQGIGELGRVNWSRVRLEGIPATTRLVIQVFLQGISADRGQLEEAWGVDALGSLMRVGLLIPEGTGPDAWMGACLVYPVEGRWMCSDRVLDTHGAAMEMGGDAVFPALYPGTLRFVRMLPRGGRTYLDLCGGCGVGAALVASDFEEVWTSDITRRARDFATVTLRLNGVTNGRSVQGAGYEAVSGKLFDVITGHPPYVPSLGDGAVFRDGGDVGEDVVRTVIEGLPAHLAMGGRALVLAFGRDTAEAAWADRVRGWLGPAGDGFDLVLGVFDRKSPEAIARELAQRHSGGSEEAVRRLMDLFERHATRGFVYGALYLERRSAADGPPITGSYDMVGEKMSPSDLPERLRWTRLRGGPEWVSRLACEVVCRARALTVHTRHRFTAGGVEVDECLLHLEGAMSNQAKIDPAMVPVLGLFDGRMTVGEILEQARVSGLVPGDIGLGDWAGYVANLVDRGILRFANGMSDADVGTM